jgi:hypothetical protein
MPQFEWDPEKARSNLAKHGVSFETAREVWDDPRIVWYADDIVDNELRWHAIGVVGFVTLLLVVHTHRDSATGEVVRIVSARKAAPRERKRYEQEILKFWS